MKEDGIYIVSNHSMSSKNGNGGFETRYHSFDIAEDTLGLFRSREEAEHFGDLNTKQKTELLTLQSTVERLKMERQEVEATTKLEVAEKDRQLKELTSKLEREDLALARERAELEYQEKERRRRLEERFEERSYYRKDSSEVLKFIPSVIVGLGAIFALFSMGK
jgi:hypothetical protein